MSEHNAAFPEPGSGVPSATGPGPTNPWTPGPPLQQHPPHMPFQPSGPYLVQQPQPRGTNPWLVGSLSALTALMVGGLVGFFAGFGTAAYTVLAPLGGAYDIDEYVTEVDLGFGESHIWDDYVQITVGEPDSFEPDPEYLDRYLRQFDEFVRMEVVVHNPTGEILYLEDELIISATTGAEYAEMYWSPEISGTPAGEVHPDAGRTFHIAFARYAGEEFVVHVESVYNWDLLNYS